MWCERWVRSIYTASEAQQVLDELEKLRRDLARPDLPQYGPPEQTVAAVALLGNGDIDRFHRALALAKIDPRDAMLAARLVTGRWERKARRVFDQGLEPKVARRWRQPGGPTHSSGGWTLLASGEAVHEGGTRI